MELDIEQLYPQIAAVLEPAGFRLVEARVNERNRAVQLVIHRSGGITHRDCAFVSRQVLDWAEENGIPLREKYSLEVASPGTARRFSHEREYEIFFDQRLRITWRDVTGKTQRSEGNNRGLQSGKLRLAVDEDNIIEIALDAIQVARLAD